MKAQLARKRLRGRSRVAVVTAALGFFWGCSTTELKPEPVPAAQPPEYVKVPQPAGFDIGDVQGLFVDRTALGEEAIKVCDSDYRKLRGLTQSEDELRKGATELVKQDPVFYHWCFYGKILELEAAIKSLNYVDERQKKVIEVYSFIVPVARGFMSQYSDSRYLRWAIRHYRHLSTVVFYQKLTQTPEMTAQLVEVANPFGLYREPVQSGSVLEKYHLARKPADKKAVAAAGGVALPAISNSDIAGAAKPEAAGAAKPEVAAAAKPALDAPAPSVVAGAETAPGAETVPGTAPVQATAEVQATAPAQAPDPAQATAQTASAPAAPADGTPAPASAPAAAAPATQPTEVAETVKPLFPPPDSDEPLVPPGANPADTGARVPASESPAVSATPPTAPVPTAPAPAAPEASLSAPAVPAVDSPTNAASGATSPSAP